MSYTPNLRQFPVTPGATFTLSTAIAATKSADHAGYVTIIFMDAGGKGGRRDFLWFEPSRRTLGEVTTGPNGGYQIRLPLAAALAPQTIRAKFEGNIAMRPAWAEHFAPDKTGAPAPALAEPVVNPKQKLIVFAPRKDFWQAYENGASWDDLAKQWPKGSASINTLALTEGQVRLLQDDTLMRLMHDLNAHHFAPQLGILATNWFHEPPCGGGVEGYSDPGSANATVAKLLLAGASPSIITMDEPLYFGHYYQGKNACRSAIQDVAQRAAVIVKIYTAAFPNLIVGDAEPFPAISTQQGWQADYAKWVGAFHNATGTSLSFTDIDFNWGDPRLNKKDPPTMSDPVAIATLSRSVAQVIRANGLSVGMFYTGLVRLRTHAGWRRPASIWMRSSVPVSSPTTSSSRAGIPTPP
jgi:hypothetical protein